MPSSRRVIFAVLSTLLVTLSVGSGSAAAAQDSFRFSTSPPLSPAFDPAVRDYVVSCQSGTPVQVTVRTPANTKVSVDGGPRQKRTFTTAVQVNPGQAFSVVATAPGKSVTDYHVRCLPSDFPAYRVERNGTPQTKFFIADPSFMTTFAPPPLGTSPSYIAIFNSYGTPVWWRRSEPGVPLDAKMLPNGNLAWTRYFIQNPGGTGAPYEEHRLDGSTVRTISAVGTKTDPHELQRLSNGNYLLITFTPQEHQDLSACGGPSDATLIDNKIQEVTPDGALVWSWSSRDHIPLSEVEQHWRSTACTGSGRSAGDVYHMNSLEISGDSVVASYRHLDAVYKITRNSGNITWKLGGTSRAESLAVVGDPVFTSGSNFGGQHDARVLGDGTVTLHDNQTQRPGRPRAVRYEINISTKTARMVEQVGDPDVAAAACCGSARKLAGGNWLASWGANPAVTELTPSGSRVFRLTFTSGLFSHRADPVTSSQVTIGALRAGMDAQNPR